MSKTDFEKYLDEFYEQNASAIEAIEYDYCESRADMCMRRVKSRAMGKGGIRGARASVGFKRVMAFAAAIVLVVVPVLMFAGVIEVPGLNAPMAAAPEAAAPESAGFEAAPAEAPEAAYEEAAPAPEAEEAPAAEAPAMEEAPAEEAPAMVEAPAEEAPAAEAETAQSPVIAGAYVEKTHEELLADDMYGTYVPLAWPEGYETDLKCGTLDSLDAYQLKMSYMDGEGQGFEMIIGAYNPEADYGEVLLHCAGAPSAEDLKELARASEFGIAFEDNGVAVYVRSNNMDPDILQKILGSAKIYL